LILLGIETATEICGVALLQDGLLLGEYRLNVKNEHARWLARAISALCADVHVTVREIDGLAISIGPGSFTGLRIGLSMAKGLALNRNMKIAAVPTLQALASQAPVRDGFICPVLKARSEEYYYALFERSHYNDIEKKSVQVLPLEQLFASLPAGTTVVGKLPDLIGHVDTSLYHLVEDYWSHLCAFTIGRIGYRMMLSGQIDDIESLEPRYFQDFITGSIKTTVV
jgi:tRNA threonylcarbamoyladenosine biosynthesis protein TsaB